jgi:hypothetical protein
MGPLTPAGGLAKKDIRNLLIRSTTWQSVSVLVFATALTTFFKYDKSAWLSNSGDSANWPWILPFLPAIGFLLKKAMTFSFKHAQMVGVGVGTKKYAYIKDFVASVAQWQGLPAPHVVGFGPGPSVSVTVTNKIDLMALRNGRVRKRQKVYVKIGTPLLMTLSQRQIAVLVSFHLAILAEPLPAMTSSLLHRQAEFASAKPDSFKAKRGLRLAERTRQFTADINTRGWARADAAAGSREAAQQVFAAAAVVMKDFTVVEGRYQSLLENERPRPMAFYYGWAVSRRAAQNMCPGETPYLDSIDLLVDKTIVSSWVQSELPPWKYFAPTWAGGVIDNTKKKNPQDTGLSIPPERYDYTWLLADPYGLQTQAAQQQHSAWSQY